ncbi:uncharacterized protein KY384_004422 [Bacidia gigantensis]|uniref:uncharacterized protein n=1 Tax=Bacidia gigantensis TaxID=2732470 RepID=UPI001D0504C0|nr:uncharacterized protein KY384_004422 [Bacidia gigantensis]KAG8531065.1 hypothetical protein KY384_004422 [Bacidia gigantensis]
MPVSHSLDCSRGTLSTRLLTLYNTSAVYSSMVERQSLEAAKHNSHMQHALALAERSPPKPTNFCVGAVLVNELEDEVVSTGYTLELEGNTHAEQVCFMKLSKDMQDSQDGLSQAKSMSLVLYTTMEPCSRRASGNMACVDRILSTHLLESRLQIRKVFIGVQEPEKFVGANEGRKKLGDAGVEYVHVSGYEKRILEVATAGHLK